MSTTVAGDQISGYAAYNDNATDISFQHYEGNKNSDGTFRANAYNGVTLTIDGKKMVANGNIGTIHYTEIDKSAWTSAGGPGSDSN